MKNAQVGMKVQAYKGSCIGVVIQSTTWEGEIIRVNQKSIRVRLTESTSRFGKKITSHWDNFNTEVTFRFSKVLSNGNSYYRSECGIYGGIEVK